MLHVALTNYNSASEKLLKTQHNNVSTLIPEAVPHVEKLVNHKRPPKKWLLWQHGVSNLFSTLFTWKDIQSKVVYFKFSWQDFI